MSKRGKRVQNHYFTSFSIIIYKKIRLLRPDAPVFYKEDAMLGMEAEMNRLLAQKLEKNLKI